jgi:hypothetical protein
VKSIEQLAQAAYSVWCEQSNPGSSISWVALQAREKARWIAVAQKLRAEIQAIH